MLTRSDITILMQQVDVTKAYDLLAMFKEASLHRYYYDCQASGESCRNSPSQTVSPC